jgi:hypothetical protein
LEDGANLKCFPVRIITDNRIGGAAAYACRKRWINLDTTQSGSCGSRLVLIGVAFTMPISPASQSQAIGTQTGQPNRVSVAYVATDDLVLKTFYNLLRERRALEKIQEILSPLQLPEELAIKTAECGTVNSWYTRENFKPTVTICYEYLRHVLESVPNQANPTGITPDDAAAGQFFWLALHEVGHAVFDIFDISIFGHPEDAADNFATYVLL